MKLIRTGVISFLAFMASTGSAFAESKCMLNGEEIPCSEMPKWLVALTFATPIVIIAIFIFGFIFWLWMLIDAIKNEKEDKTMWVLLIILLNLLGAIIYYFAKKRKRTQS